MSEKLTSFISSVFWPCTTRVLQINWKWLVEGSNSLVVVYKVMICRITLSAQHVCEFGDSRHPQTFWVSVIFPFRYCTKCFNKCCLKTQLWSNILQRACKIDMRDVCADQVKKFSESGPGYFFLNWNWVTDYYVCILAWKQINSGLYHSMEL